MSPTGAAQPTVLTDRGESAPWSSAPSGETLCKGSPVRDKAAVGDETIEGALVVPLRRIPDERGTILHMLKRTRRALRAVRRDLLHDDLPGRGQGMAQAPGDDAQLRVHLRSHQARALRRPRGLADEGRAPGDLPRPRQPLARRHPARCLERLQGDERPVRDRRQLLHASARSRRGRRASTRSTTTSPTTGGSTPLTSATRRQAEPKSMSSRIALYASLRERAT